MIPITSINRCKLNQILKIYVSSVFGCFEWIQWSHTVQTAKKIMSLSYIFNDDALLKIFWLTVCTLCNLTVEPLDVRMKVAEMSVDFGVPSLYGFVSPWPMVVDSCRFIKLGDSLYFLMHNAMVLLGYIWQLKHMWNKTLEVNDYRSTNSWNIFFVLFNSVRKLGLSRTLTKISQGIYSVSSSDWNFEWRHSFYIE